MNSELRIAVLHRMIEQLKEIIGDLAAKKPDSMSSHSYERTLRDARAQLDALEWAHNTCVGICRNGKEIAEEQEK